jgi:hypothetical protein
MYVHVVAAPDLSTPFAVYCSSFLSQPDILPLLMITSMAPWTSINTSLSIPQQHFSFAWLGSPCVKPEFTLQAALRAFESVPLARRRGPVGGWAPWRGEPRALQGGAGASAGTSRRAAGGPSGARRAVEKPWRGGGAGELLGGTGGWAAGGQRRRGRVGRREKWLYFSYTSPSGI